MLSDVASTAGMLDPVDHKLVITLTILSLANSPLWMSIAKKFQAEDGRLSFHRIRPTNTISMIKGWFKGQDAKPNI